MKLRFFTYIALTGFALSFITHFSTFLGIDPQKEFPFVWILHIGIFIVFIPAVNCQKKNQDKNFDGTKFAPNWMRFLCGVFGFYAIVNFVIFMGLMGNGSPSIVDGSYVLSNHGNVIRTIDEVEYNKYKSYEVRGFSGHWMLFYLLSATLLSSEERRKNEVEKDFFRNE